MNKTTAFFALSALAIVTGACSPATQNRQDGIIGMPNPASVNCAKLGGKLEIRDDGSGEYAICHLADGNICEEWALFRGECPK